MPRNSFRYRQRKCCVISRLLRDVDDIGGLLGYKALYSGNSLPTFRYNLSVASPRVNRHLPI